MIPIDESVPTRFANGSMVLIRNGRRAEDPWIRAVDGEPVPAGCVVVPLVRWRAEADELAERNDPLGLSLANNDDLTMLTEQVAQFALICLEFPSFTDGRAFSQARILRDRLGYTGELRATGNILRDQIAFMKRCGFDSFEFDQEPVEDWTLIADEISVTYQDATNSPATVARRRNGENIQ